MLEKALVGLAKHLCVFTIVLVKQGGCLCHALIGGECPQIRTPKYRVVSLGCKTCYTLEKDQCSSGAKEVPMTKPKALPLVSYIPLGRILPIHIVFPMFPVVQCMAEWVVLIGNSWFVFVTHMKVM